MITNTTRQNEQALLLGSNAPDDHDRYRRPAAPPASVDALLGFDASTPSAPAVPEGWIGFHSTDTSQVSPLDAWAEAFGIGPSPSTSAGVQAPPTSNLPAAAPASTPLSALAWPAPQPPLTSAPGMPWQPCLYPMVGGGFDCTREGTRIILPPIRWPLLPPLERAQGKASAPKCPLVQSLPAPPRSCPPPPALPRMPSPTLRPGSGSDQDGGKDDAAINPLCAPRASRLPRAPSPPSAPQPSQAATAIATATATPAPPIELEPAWRREGYAVPPFTRAQGEAFRRTQEFPVLQSTNTRRQVWHYCSVMAQQGIFAGHFEVHALSRVDMAGRGWQHRIIVYSRGAHTKAGTYQLAMDTHPEGPSHQPRLFLLHDAQANHYRFLAVRDTTHPKEVVSTGEAQAVESGGAGDCLFFSVARGLGFGGYNQQAATRLRRMATCYLFHHPDASLNGDTLALFVNKL